MATAPAQTVASAKFGPYQVNHTGVIHEHVAESPQRPDGRKRLQRVANPMLALTAEGLDDLTESHKLLERGHRRTSYKTGGIVDHIPQHARAKTQSDAALCSSMQRYVGGASIIEGIAVVKCGGIYTPDILYACAVSPAKFF